jgi:GNAT superfamily N-acetyltransferase
MGGEMNILVTEAKMIWSLRPAVPSDEPLIFELFTSSRERELLPLPAALREIVARQQYEAYQMGLAANYPTAEHFIIETPSWDNGVGPMVPAGRMLFVEESESFLLIDLAIDPSCRNRGLGRAILEMQMDRCRKSGKALRGSVTPYNPARRLYARLGIVELSASNGYIGLSWQPD